MIDAPHHNQRDAATSTDQLRQGEQCALSSPNAGRWSGGDLREQQ